MGASLSALSFVPRIKTGDYRADAATIEDAVATVDVVRGALELATVLAEATRPEDGREAAEAGEVAAGGGGAAVGGGEEADVWNNARVVPSKLTDGLFAPVIAEPGGLGDYALLGKRTPALLKDMLRHVAGPGRRLKVGDQPPLPGQCYVALEAFVRRTVAGETLKLADQYRDNERLAKYLTFQAEMTMTLRVVAAPGEGKTAAALLAAIAATSPRATAARTWGAVLAVAPTSVAEVWKQECRNVEFGDSKLDFREGHDIWTDGLRASELALNIMKLRTLELVRRPFGDKTQQAEFEGVVTELRTGGKAAAGSVRSTKPHIRMLAHIFKFVSDPKNVVILDDIGVYLARTSLSWFYEMCRCTVIVLDATPKGHSRVACLKYLHQEARGDLDSLCRLVEVVEGERAGAGAGEAARSFDTADERARKMAAAQLVPFAPDDVSAVLSVGDEEVPASDDDAQLKEQENAALEETFDGDDDDASSAAAARWVLPTFAKVVAFNSCIPPKRYDAAAIDAKAKAVFARVKKAAPQELLAALEGPPTVVALMVDDPGALSKYDMIAYRAEWSNRVVEERERALCAVFKLAVSAADGVGLPVRGAVSALSPAIVNSVLGKIKEQSPAVFTDANTGVIHGKTPTEQRGDIIAAARARSAAGVAGCVAFTMDAAGVGVDLASGSVSAMVHPQFLPNQIIQTVRRVRAFPVVFIVLRRGSFDAVVFSRAAAIGQRLGVIRKACINMKATWPDDVDVVEMIQEHGRA